MVVGSGKLPAFLYGTPFLLDTWVIEYFYSDIFLIVQEISLSLQGKLIAFITNHKI